MARNLFEMAGQGVFGIHHVTCIAGSPQINVDFYVRVLGLRLVKVTVNFDEPSTYHLYFGDGLGRPGTLITFFAWPEGRRGLLGSGQASTVGFSIPPSSVEYWVERLKAHGVAVSRPSRRFGCETVVSFRDPDGLRLELVAADSGDPRGGWDGGPVPERHALKGVYAVTLSEREAGPTDGTLRLLGFERLEAGATAGRLRYALGGGGPGGIVDVEVDGSLTRGVVGVGSVHHVAYRVCSKEEQAAWRGLLLEKGYKVTKVYDRLYFNSIYFREAGGVLFEIATDTPGFTVDEPEESLGSSLKLPPWLEQDRLLIRSKLPPIAVPAGWRRIP